MCGRFTLTRSAADVATHFGLEETPSLAVRFNIAPGREVATVFQPEDEPAPALAWRTWGLVPHWARTPAMGSRPINARSETAAERPTFRDALRHRRCLVPADGFYEWRGGPRQRRPVHLSLRGGALFGMAGLYERWEGEGGALTTFTVLTTAADPVVAPIHDRMPVIVDPACYAAWLDPHLDDGAAALAALRAGRAAALQIRAVGPAVNDARHEGADCLDPDPQSALF